MHAWLQHNFHKYLPYWWQMFPRANAECALAVSLNSLSSHLPSLLPASSLSGTSHLKQSSGNNCHKQKKQQKNLFIWLEQQSKWIHATMGSEGNDGSEWNFDIHTKEWNQFERKTYLSILCFFFAPLMFFRWWKKKNMALTLLGIQAAHPVDNYRLVLHWHYQDQCKQFPNYVWRDKNTELKVCRVQTHKPIHA